MSTDHPVVEPSPISGDDLLAAGTRAGDVLVVVDADGVCEWTSTAMTPSLGRPLRDSLHADDAGLLTVLLSGATAGPTWLRIKVGPDDYRWVSAVSVARTGGAAGWVLQLRDPHPLDVDAQGHAGGVALDEVTGVANREHALDQVAWLLSATPRTGKEIAVACVGLDGFTEVNAQHGQLAGDEILRIVAGRIADALRSGDLVARLEGDQLLVVMRGVHHLRGAIRVANKIRVVVEDPIPLPTGDILQTVSVGVTLISRGESVDSVLERAEGAMAMAKEAGRNTVMSSPPL